MAKPHVLTYRPGDGRELVLHIPAKVDYFDLLDWTQKRLFPEVTDEQRKADGKRADEIMKRSREQARRAA